MRADEAEIWDALDAVEVVVLERERAALVSSADGGGTDSRMTWDLAKAFWRYAFSSGFSCGTEVNGVGERV